MRKEYYLFLFLKKIIIILLFIHHASYAEKSVRQDTIIVNARKNPKKDVIDQFSKQNISHFGAMTIGEVITRLEHRNGGKPFSIIVNGKRLANITDLQEVPPEALEKIEILDKSNSSKNGFDTKNNTLNLILKKKFLSFVLEGGSNFPTESKGNSHSISFRYTKIKDENRFNTAISLQESSSIKGNDRRYLFNNPNNENLNFYRNLLPSSRSLTITPGWSLPLRSTNINLYGLLSSTISREISQFSSENITDKIHSFTKIHEIPNITHTQSYQFGISATGTIKKINWMADLKGSISKNYSYNSTSRKEIFSYLSDEELKNLPKKFIQTITSTNNSNLGFFLTTNISLFDIPAGGITANTRTGFDAQHLTARTKSEKFYHTTDTKLHSQLHAGLDIPLISSDIPFIGRLGSISLSLNGNYEKLDSKRAPSHDLTLEWYPYDGVSLNLTKSVTQSLPTLDRNNNPVVINHGMFMVDPMTGQYALVTSISGGNPDFKKTSQKDTTVQINYNKNIGHINFSFSTQYTKSILENPIIFSCYPNIQFEHVFPNRFIRNKFGQLIAIDTRAFNALNEQTSTLNTNIHLFGHLDLKTPQDEFDWDLSISHQWAIKDRLQPTQDTKYINLLKKPLDGSAGTTPHQLNIETIFSYKNFNLQISAKWHSGIYVQDITSTTPYSTHYSGFWITNSELSYTIKEKSSDKNKPIKIWLSLENLLNKRQSIKDSKGITPLAYQPAFLDPIGRTIKIRISRSL
ncbi:hypothetical protein FBY50_1096 [Zymomonas mobilis]|uniref:hypothetical protein n=1 Tax=Zymomonas mobilis TaxID=542 RepID=UPI000B37A63C|nr:hypothetical protein [Zymomonas mobilis]ART93567.1 hypothetical protein B9T50_05230 [Zymomonas mobilis subsp. mobilis]TWD60279.1 hypothetical protein FBY50_1096 [Zymomonas mobilis]